MPRKTGRMDRLPTALGATRGPTDLPPKAHSFGFLFHGLELVSYSFFGMMELFFRYLLFSFTTGLFLQEKMC
jgi:hypothetical protein